MSLQNTLNKFFTAMGELFKCAFSFGILPSEEKSESRSICPYERSIMRGLLPTLRRGSGGCAVAWASVAGSRRDIFELPDTQELRSRFSVHQNQHAGAKSEQVQALAVVMHDLLNDLAVASALAPSHTAERSVLFNQLWHATEDGDVLVLDRTEREVIALRWKLREAKMERDILKKAALIFGRSG